MKDTTPRALICINNGRIYESCNGAARALGLDPSAVHRVADGSRQRTHGYFFTYLDLLKIPPSAYGDYCRYELARRLYKEDKNEEAGSH